MSETLHEIYRLAHVAVGVAGLFLFWVPVFTRKGSAAHRAAGRWFVRSVYLVAGTGLFSSIWALVAPLSFFHATELPSAEVRSQVRFLFTIFGFLAILALHGAILGLRVLKVKDDRERVLNMPLIGIMVLQLLWGAGLAAYGAAALWQSGFESRYYVTILLALVGLWDLVEQRNYIRRPQPTGAWLSKHLECMIGCGVAFYTAALVTVSAVVLKLDLPGAWALVPWLLPTAIGIPATHLAASHYRDPLKPTTSVIVGSQR